MKRVIKPTDKKPRLLYIDLIRVVATFLIILHHLHFHFLDFKLFTSETLWKNNFLNLSLGDIGVSLFIFISGLGLVLSLNNKKFKIKEFYKKRVLRIYPDFLIAYFFFFAWYQLKNYFPNNIKIPNFILSLTGLDTYLTSFFSFISYSFFDWFIGFILILYLIFPLLYYIYKKDQRLLLLLATLLLSLTLYFSDGQINLRHFTLRILEFSLGMCYAKFAFDHNIKKRLYVLAFSSMALFSFINTPSPIFIIIRFILLDFILIETSYFIGKILANLPKFSKIITYLASISYLVFLLQHQMIIRIMGDLFLLNKPFAYPVFMSPLLFQSVLITLTIVAVAVLLSTITKATTKTIESINCKLVKN